MDPKLFKVVLGIAIGIVVGAVAVILKVMGAFDGVE